jgi:hypothetical protein
LYVSIHLLSFCRPGTIRFQLQLSVGHTADKRYIYAGLPGGLHRAGYRWLPTSLNYHWQKRHGQELERLHKLVLPGRAGLCRDPSGLGGQRNVSELQGDIWKPLLAGTVGCALEWSARIPTVRALGHPTVRRKRAWRERQKRSAAPQMSGAQQ